jgi:hypothetical protein
MTLLISSFRAFRFLESIYCTFKVTLWVVICVFLTGLSSRAQYITYGVHFPIQYVGEPVYDSYTGYTITLYEQDGEATAFPFSHTTDDSDFTVLVGTDTATILMSDLISAGDMGYVWPSFVSNTNLRILLPEGSESNAFALAQVDTNGTVYTTPFSPSTSLHLQTFASSGVYAYFPKAWVTYDPSRPFLDCGLNQSKKGRAR